MWATMQRSPEACGLTLIGKVGGAAWCRPAEGRSLCRRPLVPPVTRTREGQACDVAQGPALRLLLFIMKEKETRRVKLPVKVPGFRCLPGIVVSR